MKMQGRGEAIKCELGDKNDIPYVLFSSFRIIDPICMERTPN